MNRQEDCLPAGASRKQGATPADDTPFISVIVPMRNEAQHIAACLESILAQDYPRERLEVLVLDGDSEDDSRQVITRYARQDGRVRLLRNAGKIVPTGLNAGIRAARGELIARVDAHTTLAPDYLRQGVAALRRSQAANAGGSMMARGGGAVGDAVAMAMNSPFGIGAYFHFGRQERFVDTVYMGMWPRNVFRRLGLFDEELVRNQDDEFNYRLRKHGGRILLAPQMRSSYQNRCQLKALARQFYEYGLWKVRICQKHPRQMSWRHLLPPALVLSLLLGGPAAWLVPPLGVAAMAAAAAYLVALAVACGTVARRREQRSAAAMRRLPVVFAVIHCCWGWGFLVGLVRFAPHWFRREPQPPHLLGNGATSQVTVDFPDA